MSYTGIRGGVRERAPRSTAVLRSLRQPQRLRRCFARNAITSSARVPSHGNGGRRLLICSCRLATPLRMLFAPLARLLLMLSVGRIVALSPRYAIALALAPVRSSSGGDRAGRQIRRMAPVFRGTPHATTGRRHTALPKNRLPSSAGGHATSRVSRALDRLTLSMSAELFSQPSSKR